MTVRLNLYRYFTTQQELELRLALERAGFTKQEVDWTVRTASDPATTPIEPTDPTIMRALERRVFDIKRWMQQYEKVSDQEIAKMREVEDEIDDKLLEVLAAAADARPRDIRPRLSLEAIVRKVAEARAKLLNKLVGKSVASARARAIRKLAAQSRLEAKMMGALKEDYYNIIRGEENLQWPDEEGRRRMGPWDRDEYDQDDKDEWEDEWEDEDEEDEDEDLSIRPKLRQEQEDED